MCCCCSSLTSQFGMKKVHWLKFLLSPFCQEKRRLQEEQDRVRREMEEEKLRLQQLKVCTQRTSRFIHGGLHAAQTCVVRTHAGTVCRPILTCRRQVGNKKQLCEQSATLSFFFFLCLFHFSPFRPCRKVRGRSSFGWNHILCQCLCCRCSIVFPSFPHWRSHFLLHFVAQPRGHIPWIVENIAQLPWCKCARVSSCKVVIKCTVHAPLCCAYSVGKYFILFERMNR